MAHGGDTAGVSLVIVILFIWPLLLYCVEHVAYLILYSEVVYGLCFRMTVDVLFGCIMFCGLTCHDSEDVPFDCVIF